MQVLPNPKSDQDTTSASDATGAASASAGASNRAAAGVVPIRPTSNRTRSAASTRLLEHYLVKRQATVLQLIAELLEAPNLGTGLMGLVDALHHQFDCSRVAVGVFRSSRLQIAAISQQASFDPLSDEVARLKAALQEACDQEVIVQYPDAVDETIEVEAHEALNAGRPHGQLLSMPLCHAGELVGGLLLECPTRRGWSRFTLELLAQVAELSAALVALRLEVEQGLVGVTRRSLRTSVRQITGPRHMLLKSIASILVIGSLLAVFVPVTHRVSAEAEVVPTVRRVISAPMEGFVDSVLVRVGDRVAADGVLLRLDTRQLALEQGRLTGEIRGIETEMRAALAGRDRKETVVLYARKAQAAAELARVEQQLERAVLRAPVDGIIVSGDIDEITGAPVKLGESLLEIAPFVEQDVHLLVDETDIGHVKVGQSGALSLTSSPGRALPFEVSAIHPIAQSAEGQNRIRVEATLPADATPPLPGQTGIGKIAVGQASLLWVWTHRFTHWARQLAWQWFG